MRYLLDTCTLIWFLGDDSSHLSETLLVEIENEENAVFVSVASIWEMAVKASLGKLELPLGLESIESNLQGNGFEILDIRIAHAAEVYALPLVHRDPFDRLMISQCRVEKLTAITNDSVWSAEQYDIAVKW